MFHRNTGVGEPKNYFDERSIAASYLMFLVRANESVRDGAIASRPADVDEELRRERVRSLGDLD